MSNRTVERVNVQPLNAPLKQYPVVGEMTNWFYVELKGQCYEIFDPIYLVKPLYLCPFEKCKNDFEKFFVLVKNS